jgi:hypothetical protein
MQFYNPQQGAAPVPVHHPAQQQGQGFYGANPGNNYNNNAGAGGNSSAVPQYLQNVSPEMINFGINAGTDILQRQKDRWMPGLSGFWHSLKYYFLVCAGILTLYWFHRI